MTLPPAVSSAVEVAANILRAPALPPVGRWEKGAPVLPEERARMKPSPYSGHCVSHSLRSARAGARAGVRAVARSVAAARLVVADKVVEVPTMEAAQAPQPEADQEVIGSTRRTSRRRSGRR